MLGVVYDRLIEYAEGDRGNQDDAEWFRSLRKQWKDRLDAGDWPEFQAKRSGPVVKGTSPDGERWSWELKEYEILQRDAQPGQLQGIRDVIGERSSSTASH